MVLLVDWLDTGHYTGERPVAKVEAVAAVAVRFGQLFVRVEMLEDCLELRIPPLASRANRIGWDEGVVLESEFF